MGTLASKSHHVIGIPLCWISVEVTLAGIIYHLKILATRCKHRKCTQDSQRALSVPCHCTILLKKTCYIILIVATSAFAQLFLHYFLLINQDDRSRITIIFSEISTSWITTVGSDSQQRAECGKCPRQHWQYCIAAATEPLCRPCWINYSVSYAF